jgi:hypothetical protein
MNSGHAGVVSFLNFAGTSCDFPGDARRGRTGWRDEVTLKEIFDWMQILLASRTNIRILHNANSRQTRQKEREGRCMEDATIN